MKNTRGLTGGRPVHTVTELRKGGGSVEKPPPARHKNALWTLAMPEKKD